MKNTIAAQGKSLPLESAMNDPEDCKDLM